MTGSARILEFPNKSIQKIIPVEQLMSKEIAKEDVTLELLCSRLQDAGYEAVLIDEEISVQRTGCNLRIKCYPELACLRIFGCYLMKNDLPEADLDVFIAQVSAKSFMVNFSSMRWDDGSVGVFGSHVTYYPFGLNLPNFIFTMRRLIDGMSMMMREYADNAQYFPQSEEAG
jgi:hypothetical protein